PGEHRDPIDHPAQRLTRGIVEIGIQAERDEVRRSFRTRQAPAQILAHVEFEGALERGLDRSAVHLSVTLSGMAVAGREQAAFVPYRQINGAARDELLAVEIAAELAWLLAVLPSEIFRRGHRELSEERPHRHLQP